MAREPLLHSLLQRLWQEYIGRVAYARTYVELVEQKGGEVHNDHIAFRTFNVQAGGQPAGVEALARIFEPLGYSKKEHYTFPSKHLNAWHWEHENPMNPKIFISQLETNQLPDEVAEIISRTMDNAPDPLTEDSKALLARADQLRDKDIAALVPALHQCFTRPWAAPRKRDVERMNELSQYAAWTLLHGNSVNHFTAFINHQQVAEWPDIDATVKGLIAAGVPMKDTVEGEPGNKLRQSSTKAVTLACDALDDDNTLISMPWTYAYYELAERGNITDAQGNETQFTGFLGEQATHLFEMTRKA